MRDGYVFESHYAAEKIQPISMTFSILNKEWLTFKKMLFIKPTLYLSLSFRNKS